MSNQPLSLNVELGPQFTLHCVNNSGPGADGLVSLHMGNRSEVVEIVVGVKSSSLFANTGGGGGSSSGTVDVSITATDPLAAFRAVTILGTYVQPNCDSLSSYAGVTLSSFSPGVTGSVVRSGLLQGGGPWIPGQPIYIGANGVLTQSLNLPEWRRIGFAVSASQVNLDPFPFLELSSANW